ncbi:MAG: TetR/AcrR family transcriptional regulator [Treponema sp.]|jgi:AcrR family transcriptional regulator|nr:TetR/AcrR family transcriptional regulator [Treponema sp.]
MSDIFEAFMLLLDQKPYNKITVSDITKRAGVARQTFYRNYTKKSDIIEHCLSKSIMIESLAAEGDRKKAGFALTFDLGYLISHKDIFSIITSKTNLQNLFFSRFREWVEDLIDTHKDYKEKPSAEEYAIYRYVVYYQIVGSVYILADWLRNGMPLPVEKLKSFLNSFALPDSLQHEQAPDIIIRLKNEQAGRAARATRPQ